MKYRLLTFLMCVMVYFSTYVYGVSQSVPEETETVERTRSLFENDTCSPPCWFGLIPGESTAEAIQTMFEENSDLFEVSRLLDNGDVVFRWTRFDRGDMFAPESFMRVQDGILSGMIVAMNKMVSLGETLDTLGNPSRVRIFPNFYVWEFVLFYDEDTAVVLRASRETCQISNMRNDFDIDSVYYYTPNEIQSLVAPWSFDYYIGVPANLWESWLQGEIKGTCENVFGDFFSRPDIRATTDSQRTQTVGTSEASQATRNAEAWATVTAHFNERLTATATPR